MRTRPSCRRSFSRQIVGLYENTRLGRQEIHAEFLETTEGVWFSNLTRRSTSRWRLNSIPRIAVRCAIDAGTSRHTAAVFFQVRRVIRETSGRELRSSVNTTRFDVMSHKNALAIKDAGR